MNHTITIKFACGHVFTHTRISGGVVDPNCCNCEACQPWDGVANSGESCTKCGGTGMYFIKDVVPGEGLKPVI